MDTTTDITTSNSSTPISDSDTNKIAPSQPQSSAASPSSISDAGMERLFRMRGGRRSRRGNNAKKKVLNIFLTLGPYG